MQKLRMTKNVQAAPNGFVFWICIVQSSDLFVLLLLYLGLGVFQVHFFLISHLFFHFSLGFGLSQGLLFHICGFFLLFLLGFAFS
jgi:hypothetical protein